MLNLISKVILLIMVVELCLGGGGHLTALGSISLRMVLFLIAMILTSLSLISGKTLSTRYWRAIITFSLTLLIGIAWGLFNNNSFSLIWEDVKPLLYFFMLPFFALTVPLLKKYEIPRIIKFGSLLLTGLFLILVLLINLNVIPFLAFYRLTENTQEFFYRGEISFFYKGFLFLGVGAIFFYFSDSKKRFFFIAVLIFAILISVTRGLLFSLAVTFAVYFVQKKQLYHAVIAVVTAAAIVFYGNPMTIHFSKWIDSNKQVESGKNLNPNLFGDRNFSDAGRYGQITEVMSAASWSSIFLGHGFGQGISSRPVHMEISYLEVFHKQGLVGLTFWAFFAGIILTSYRQVEASSEADALFYGALFIFIESLTNQYINNPIGMSMLLLFLVSLDKLKTQP